MAKIKYLKDKQGSIVFPVTHERAVKDRNGVLLEDKLKGMMRFIDLYQSDYEDLVDRGLCDIHTFYYVFGDLTHELLKICIGDIELCRRSGGGFPYDFPLIF